MNKKRVHTRYVRSFNLKRLTIIILGSQALQVQAADTFTMMGYMYSNPFAVSSDGTTMVGEGYMNDNNREAFRWTAGGGMQGLGFIGNGNESSASAVSTDGSVVVGYGYNGSSNTEAFRWTAAGGMQGLGFIGNGNFSYALAVSSDGTVVVGGSDNTIGYREAFRWTAAGGMQGLGFIGTGTSSSAYAVSANGSVVVGDGSDSNGLQEAFRWTAKDGMQGLGFIGTGYSHAQAVSADGKVVVGGADNHDNKYEAFRWTARGGMQGLGFIGNGNYSYAQAVSADGGVVVGAGYDSNNNQQAFRWTSAGGMQGLGFIGTDSESRVNAVSADGKVVVGVSGSYGLSNNAFRWSSTAGMQSIPQWLSGAGVSVATGWTPQEAISVSANGNVVVGYANDEHGNQLAWLARVGSGSGLLTNLNAFNYSLIETGSRAIQAGAAMPNMTMFGAHHRSILDNGLTRTTANGMCGWVTADASNNTNTHSSSQLSEIGVCKDFKSARIGVGIGQAWTQQDLSLNGSARFNGQYLVLEGVNAYANGLQPSITGYYGRFDTQMSRNYTNGATVDNSNARPHATAYALRARLDWKDVTKLSKFSLSPYIAYTWAKTQLDAYTETGGGFPAQYNASSWSTDDLRVGGAAKAKLSDKTDLRLGLEGVHRFDGNTSGVNVSVVGLSVFNNSLLGQQVTQTWVHATVDVDHLITEKLALTVGGSAATKGGDAIWGATAGLRMNF